MKKLQSKLSTRTQIVKTPWYRFVVVRISTIELPREVSFKSLQWLASSSRHSLTSSAAYLLWLVSTSNVSTSCTDNKNKPCCSSHILFLFCHPHNVTITKDDFQNGKKAQGNQEAYVAWAFSSKYNKHHEIIVGRRWRDR